MNADPGSVCASRRTAMSNWPEETYWAPNGHPQPDYKSIRWADVFLNHCAAASPLPVQVIAPSIIGSDRSGAKQNSTPPDPAAS